MATTSDTAAQTAPGNLVNKLFTSKNLTPAQRRLRWVIIGIWVIQAYIAVCVVVGDDPWTIWRLYAGLAGLGVPLLVLVFWFPVVWASLRWLARVAWRCVVPSSSGRRGGVASLLAPLLGLGMSASILWAFGYASLYFLTPYVQDWRSGTVRHEAVTCRDFDVDNSVTHSGKAQYVFELVSSDGSSWEYRERKRWMDDRVEAANSPTRRSLTRAAQRVRRSGSSCTPTREPLSRRGGITDAAHFTPVRGWAWRAAGSRAGRYDGRVTSDE